MNIERFSKEEIALRQIETALRLYSEGGDPFSVITLAGAAEEILGQLLARAKGEGAAATSIFRIFRPKRGNEGEGAGLSGREEDGFVHMDADREARFLLGRAIEDYRTLTGRLSAAMVRFET